MVCWWPRRRRQLVPVRMLAAETALGPEAAIRTGGESSAPAEATRLRDAAIEITSSNCCRLQGRSANRCADFAAHRGFAALCGWQRERPTCTAASMECSPQDRQVLDRLLEGLADTPTPVGPTPRGLAAGTPSVPQRGVEMSSSTAGQGADKADLPQKLDRPSIRSPDLLTSLLPQPLVRRRTANGHRGAGTPPRSLIACFRNPFNG
jgi:hypothetical protein